MHFHRRLIGSLAASTLFFLAVFSCSRASAGTMVQINTSLGAIKLRLNDEVTPTTVTNFLNYLPDYQNTIIHRSVPGFIVQGGGFNTGGVGITTDPPIVNEFSLPNVTGTVAMAKLGGNPNSATSQWFFNLADNRENLDNQNGGFTVFGHVIEGMNIVNQIAALPTFAFGGAFGELPLRNYTQTDYNNEKQIGTDNLVVITSVQNLGPWTPAWHNSTSAFDVNNDGHVVPQDLLFEIDAMNRSGFRELLTPLVGPYFIDVNRNGVFDANDIERTISKLNDSAGQGLLTTFESSLSLSAVPEPSGAMLTFIGAAILAATRRLRRAVR